MKSRSPLDDVLELALFIIVILCKDPMSAELEVKDVIVGGFMHVLASSAVFILFDINQQYTAR